MQDYKQKLDLYQKLTSTTSILLTYLEEKYHVLEKEYNAILGLAENVYTMLSENENDMTPMQAIEMIEYIQKKARNKLVPSLCGVWRYRDKRITKKPAP